MFISPTRGGTLNWLLSVIAILLLVILLTTKSAQAPIAEDPLAPIMYTVTIENQSLDQPLSPGVFVTHTADFSLNHSGAIAPTSFKPLAEYGDPAPLITDLINTPDSIYDLVSIDTPIEPGASRSFTVQTDPVATTYVSGIHMAVATNDGFILVDSVALDGTQTTLMAPIYDNGTEENSPLGSGFSGGQPDPSRGPENIENGTPTEPAGIVTPHPQFTEPFVLVTLSPVVDQETE